jgi:hypothetical protein
MKRLMQRCDYCGSDGNGTVHSGNVSFLFLKRQHVYKIIFMQLFYSIENHVKTLDKLCKFL